ncbi:hypothetical protein HOLleu_18696 [Holothuria leucospilota]|uniref:PKD domain-containing protein n=1 Tax=Holothuria leucospilota TaxID=206669 RepID=A0A9Q1C4J9_HOLLE|nr:hypothetical protein HOLleu_18696 [Holothuria leucospilota]
MSIRLDVVFLVFLVGVVQRSVGDSLNPTEDLPYNVTVVADGPTLLGATTTFVATLDTGTDFQDTTYKYTWSEVFGYLIPRVKSTYSEENCTFSRPYTRPEDVRDHIMSVKVYRKSILWVMVAQGSVTFQVTAHIPAHVILSQNETVCNGPVCDVATNQSAQLTVSIHDPSSYLQNTISLFDWDFGDENQNPKTTSMSLSHVYSEIGCYNVSVNITAVQPSGSVKTGNAIVTLLLKDAIHNLTINGLEHVTVGDKKTINITCSGSPPISFCWSIFQANMSSSLPVMRSCIQTYLQEECQTEIDYSFNTSKEYILRVRATNDVSFQALTAEIRPREPPVLTSDGIAGLVVGICFGLTLTCISIGIISHQIHKERMRHVEVADFNFEASSRYDSIREHARRLNDAKKKPTEKTPLLNKNPTLDVRWVKGSETVEL